MLTHKPTALIILDGWGHAEPSTTNAITCASTPNWDAIWSRYPHTLLQGSGKALGLPEGQMGNSEVGHLTLGSGRIIYQDLTRINQAIEDRSFFENTVLLQQIQDAQTHQKALHIIGLLSEGGIHSHESHLYALLDLTHRFELNNVYIHAFLDGRDTPPKSAYHSLRKLESFCQTHKNVKIASLIGRYYAMDRDQNWDRIKKAHTLITQGIASYYADSAIEGLELAYARGETDEFLQATQIGSASCCSREDTVFFINFRADRARQLTQALIEPDFQAFERPFLIRSLCTLTQYSETLATQVAFPRKYLKNTLGEILSQHHLKQLRVAETEKYAHVTFFFNGGVETPFPLEARCLIPSPAVKTYDLKPEMSAIEMTQYLVDAIKAQQQDVIICNFANPDMVGHTGNLKATIQAIETVDSCIGKIINALNSVGGEAIITADHGNAEYLYNRHTGQAHTAHTCALVPFVYVGRSAVITPNQTPDLSAIAPTLLYLLGLPIPSEMSGTCLVKLISY